MARYIVIRVESHSTADELLKRFAVVPAIQICGLFASPTKFCEGKCERPKNDMGVRVSTRSKKWGLSFCPVCKLPLKTMMQHPRNLLQPADLPSKFVDMFLSVWEPFELDASKVYGADAIERTKAQIEVAAERIRKSKNRQRRKAKKNG